MKVLDAIRKIQPGEVVVVVDDMFFRWPVAVAAWYEGDPEPIPLISDGDDRMLPEIGLFYEAEIRKMRGE